MAAPTLLVRNAVKIRDQFACILCHTTDGLQFNHRRATGMGGSKIRPELNDGNLLCGPCNELIEQDAGWMVVALAYGLKVKKWVTDPGRVPLFYPHEHQWYRLAGIHREPIGSLVALDSMHAVYGDEYLRWKATADDTDRARLMGRTHA